MHPIHHGAVGTLFDEDRTSPIDIPAGRVGQKMCGSMYILCAVEEFGESCCPLLFTDHFILARQFPIKKLAFEYGLFWKKKMEEGDQKKTLNYSNMDISRHVQTMQYKKSSSPF